MQHCNNEDGKVHSVFTFRHSFEVSFKFDFIEAKRSVGLINTWYWWWAGTKHVISSIAAVHLGMPVLLILSDHEASFRLCRLFQIHLTFHPKPVKNIIDNLAGVI